jgi:hypothetical protein
MANYESKEDEFISKYMSAAYLKLLYICQLTKNNKDTFLSLNNYFNFPVYVIKEKEWNITGPLSTTDMISYMLKRRESYVSMDKEKLSDIYHIKKY